MKFKIGDRVSRLTDVFNGNSKLMTGTVTKAYSEPKKIIGGDLILGPYPELYEVTWDNGNIEKGYLPHGISRISES